MGKEIKTAAMTQSWASIYAEIWDAAKTRSSSTLPIVWYLESSPMILGSASFSPCKLWWINYTITNKNNNVVYDPPDMDKTLWTWRPSQKTQAQTLKVIDPCPISHLWLVGRCSHHSSRWQTNGTNNKKHHRITVPFQNHKNIFFPSDSTLYCHLFILRYQSSHYILLLSFLVQSSLFSS